MKQVKIYSIHYNRPDFIVWQYDCFKNHLRDDFEYIIINNAREQHLRQEITKTATHLNIKYIETFFDSELVGKHHADCFNFIWKNYAIKNSNDYVIIMDGDCFLVDNFNVNLFMVGSILAGPKQKRLPKYHYLTPTIIIADIEQLPEPNSIDWEGIGIDNIRLDSGGGLYLYFLKHLEVKNKIKEFKSTWHIKADNNNKHCLPDEIVNNYNDDFNLEFFGNEFLHYCRSSNWDYKTEEHHKLKSEFVKSFIYRIIDNTLKAKHHDFQINNKIYFGWD